MILLKWSVQANKQASKHAHTRAQCSHASVGLAQACPNHDGFRGSHGAQGVLLVKRNIACDLQTAFGWLLRTTV